MKLYVTKMSGRFCKDNPLGGDPILMENWWDATLYPESALEVEKGYCDQNGGEILVVEVSEPVKVYPSGGVLSTCELGDVVYNDKLSLKSVNPIEKLRRNASNVNTINDSFEVGEFNVGDIASGKAEEESFEVGDVVIPDRDEVKEPYVIVTIERIGESRVYHVIPEDRLRVFMMSAHATRGKSVTSLEVFNELELIYIPSCEKFNAKIVKKAGYIVTVSSTGSYTFEPNCVSEVFQ